MLEFLRDFWGFLKVRKKYWLVPIIIALLLVSFAIFVTQSATTAFIYTVF